MKRFALLLLLAASVLGSAPSWYPASWDGARGPFTLATMVSPGTANLPNGLPGAPGVPDSTWIAIHCSNPEVTGVRLTIVYRNAGGTELAMTLLSDFNSYGLGAVRTAVLPDRIVSVKLTELRDGASY
jgi:hypothetical protein